MSAPQLTAVFIRGADGITLAGINGDGSPILMEIDPRAASALSRQLERAAGEFVAHRAKTPQPHHTTDHPLPDLVGRQGE